MVEGRLVRRYLPNIMDIGPRFTGPILGMSNMCATGPQPCQTPTLLQCSSACL